MMGLFDAEARRGRGTQRGILTRRRKIKSPILLILLRCVIMVDGICERIKAAMSMTLHLTYDGETLRSDEPLDLKAGARIMVTVESIESGDSGAAPYSFFHTALGMNLDGPSDWSTRLDDYLYGEPCDAKD